MVIHNKGKLSRTTKDPMLGNGQGSPIYGSGS